MTGLDLCLVSLTALLLVVWIRERDRRRVFQAQLQFLTEENRKVPVLEEALKKKEAEYHALELMHTTTEEKLQALSHAQEHLKETFALLSAEALEKSQRSFLDFAKLSLEHLQEKAKVDSDQRQSAIGELLTPVKESLGKLDQEIRKLDKERKGDQEALSSQVRSLLETEKQLRSETANLVKALRTPLARGRWGEIQLKRVVELAGMLSHCDFYEQVQEGGGARPDLLVRLPGGRQVIVDSKVPLEAFLEAVQVVDESQRELLLKSHARQVRSHIFALSKKSYWESFQPTPEFVILFLPGETFFSAALEFDPSLIEIGVEQGVVIATPTTLIALLRSVAYGWKQESLSRHAAQVEELGHELYKRLIDMSSHWTKMGKSLGSAVEAYNRAVGSLESRVLVTARKFQEMGAAAASLEIEPVQLVETIPRTLSLGEQHPCKK